MSSVNEEIPQPPKHRLSPFELRNTDLVSRLLAATPPYLYNIPLVPHSYFFSEMLRSLVQNKVEAAARMNNTITHRRPRKRTWTQGRAETYPSKDERKQQILDCQEMPPPIWTPPKVEKRVLNNFMDTNKTTHQIERPLELTMSNKIPLNNNNIPPKMDMSTNEASTSRVNDFHTMHQVSSNSTITSEKQEMGPVNHIPMIYPSMSNVSSPDNQSTSSSTSSTDLILPPPPPIWYPPIYPPPYGIDPLHFFIDLRVSGHIYDRKNQSKESGNVPNQQINTPIETNLPNTNQVLPPNPQSSPEVNFPLSREPRHCSAFSVPTPSLNLNDPLNLAKYHRTSPKNEDRRKFDIKSMGFDTSSENKQSSNYVLKNLVQIYSNVSDTRQVQSSGLDLTSPKQSSKEEEEHVQKEVEGEDQEELTEEEKEKQKKCKDLRALIGLELVVDYVNHTVKPKQYLSEESGSNTDIDSRCSSASTVEIVSIPDV